MRSDRKLLLEEIEVYKSRVELCKDELDKLEKILASKQAYLLEMDRMKLIRAHRRRK